MNSAGTLSASRITLLRFRLRSTEQTTRPQQEADGGELK